MPINFAIMLGLRHSLGDVFLVTQACSLCFVEYTYMKWQSWVVASESDTIVLHAEYPIS